MKRAKRLLTLFLIVCLVFTSTTMTSAMRSTTVSPDTPISAGLEAFWTRLWNTQMENNQEEVINVPGIKSVAQTKNNTGSTIESLVLPGLYRTQIADTLNSASSLDSDSVKLGSDAYSITAAEVTPTPESTTGTTVVKYYPVTMYNYDAAGMNAATRQIEYENSVADNSTLSEWKGLYFTDGNQSTPSHDYVTTVPVSEYRKITDINDLSTDKSYILLNADGNRFLGDFNSTDQQIDSAGTVNGITAVSTNTIQTSQLPDGIQIWKVDADNHLYYIDSDGIKQYINFTDTAVNTDGHKLAVTTDSDGSAAIAEHTTVDSLFVVQDTIGDATKWLNDYRGEGRFLAAANNETWAGSRFAIYEYTGHTYEKESVTSLDELSLEDEYLILSKKGLADWGNAVNRRYILSSVIDDNGISGVGTIDMRPEVSDSINAADVSAIGAQTWKLEKVTVGEGTAEKYVIYCEIDDVKNYIYIHTDNNDSNDLNYAGLTTDVANAANIEIDNNGNVLIAQEVGGSKCYLNKYGDLGVYKAYVHTNAASADGSFFALYKYKVGETTEATANTGNLPLADYNLWTGKIAWDPESLDNPSGGGTLTNQNVDLEAEPTGDGGADKKGNRLYNGIVKSTLTTEGDIQFNVPESGIFTMEEKDYKQVYTNVQMPFEYDTSTGEYTFDSSEMSARFEGGTGANNARLKYSDSPQALAEGEGYADGSSTMWMPYNDVDSMTGVTKDHHFGMIFSIPFFMTETGKLPGGAERDIVFDFNGDDDVWIFIDGKLVLDLGGIHNKLSGTLNFAQNTWSVYENNDVDQELSYVDGSATQGNIFATAENANDCLLTTTRETFAQTGTHTLTVFYLERGQGTSNNKISFNLLVRDSVNVMKEVSDTDANGNPLSEAVMNSIDNRDFTFRLYKDGKAVENLEYYLLNIRGQYLQTLQTDAGGYFKLKNGQTAKFAGNIDNTDVGTSTAYSIEEIEDVDTTAWAEPDWHLDTCLGSTGTVQETEHQDTWRIPDISVDGDTSIMDMLNIRCTNTFSPQDNMEVNDDRIVIDYGLPVEVDIFANDIVTDGSDIVFKGIGSADGTTTFDGVYGTAVYDSTTKKITYTLNKQLTGVEKLTYYAACKNQMDQTEGEAVSAAVYIMPATSMYYEENFGNLVTFSNTDTLSWEDKVTSTNTVQEPGVVGTVSDSPYGSDTAYMDDFADSNGTSKYVATTTSESASFAYTFTGKGTSFFARTTNNSAYIRVVINCLDSGTTKTYVDEWRIDTKYQTADGNLTLYNIPVFSWMAEEYGTYEVTVTIGRKMMYGDRQIYGNDFWLDGIKIYEPLDPAGADVSMVQTAYADDGEANCDVVTLRSKILHDEVVYSEETGKYEWSAQDINSNRFVVFTDSNGEIKTAEEYISNGPKEEVYLQKNQSVSFALEDWDPNGANVYLGIKAPMGTGKVLINGNEIEIKNSVDGYYNISDYRDMVQTTDSEGKTHQSAQFVITAGEGGIISLTTIKTTGKIQFSIITDLPSEEDTAQTPVEDQNIDIYITGAVGED